MIDQVLRLLEEGLVLSLEHLEFLQGIIADFLQFLLILFINLLLDVLPVIVGELLLVVEWVELSHLVRNHRRCLLGLNRVVPLINSLGRHGGDSRRHLLHGLADWLRVVRLHGLRLHVVFLGKSVAGNDRGRLSIMLLGGHGTLVEVGAVPDVSFRGLDVIIVSFFWRLIRCLIGGRWLRCLHILNWLRSILHWRFVELLWWRRLDNNWLLLRLLDVKLLLREIGLHLNILNCLWLHVLNFNVLWLLFVVDRLLRDQLSWLHDHLWRSMNQLRRRHHWYLRDDRGSDGCWWSAFDHRDSLDWWLIALLHDGAW